MLTIIGVGHVFDIKASVQSIIFARKPDLVCVELDKVRYDAMLNLSLKKRKIVRSVPITYKMLAIFQEIMARKYGVIVGEEMLAAVQAAEQLAADVAFIDINAAAVFNQMMQKMSFKERLKLFCAAALSLFMRKSDVEREIARFEKTTEKYIEAFGEEFPTLKKILIDDRNSYMAARLQALAKTYKNIVAVVGDGHVDGLKTLLAELKPEVIRLQEVRRYAR